MVKEILVVNQNNGREAIRHAVFHAVQRERLNGFFREHAQIRGGSLGEIVQRHDRLLIHIGRERIEAKLEAVRCVAAADAGLELGGIRVVAEGFDVDLDVGVVFFKQVLHQAQREKTALVRGEVHEVDRDRLFGNRSRGIRSGCFRRRCGSRGGFSSRGRLAAGKETHNHEHDHKDYRRFFQHNSFLLLNVANIDRPR